MRPMRLCRVAGAALAALWLANPSPAGATDLRAVLTDYTVTAWGEKDGLPLGNTWALAQDQDGYLWLGTDAGLFRFDGVRFLPWSPPITTPPLAGSVRSVLAARDGSLWIGFGESGRIVRVHHGESRVYAESDGLPRGTVTGLAEDPDGVVWAASARGLFALRDARFHKVGAESGLPDVQAYTVRFDKQRRQVVGTADGIFRRDGNGRFEQLRTTHDGPARSISENAAGRLFVTDMTVGFRTFGSAAADADDPERRGRGYAVYHDSHDNLWVGTLGQGLWRVQPGRNGDYDIDRAIELTGLSSDGVLSLLEDNDGNIWAGTSEGLNRVMPRRITRVTDLGLVTGVEAAPNDQVWVGTIDELIRFSATDASAPLARVRLPGSRLGTMHAAGNVIWAATNRGIVRLEGDNVLRPVAVTDALRQVNVLTADAKGTLWLYDQARGLFTLRGATLTPIALPDERRADRIVLMQPDSTGRVWLGFASGQLGEISGGAVRLHDATEGFQPSLVHTIHEDRDGVLWFARTDGLMRFADGRFLRLTTETGFPLRNLTGLVEDQKRNFWIGSTVGISRIDRAELMKAVGGSTEPVQYALFDRSDGIAGTPQSSYSLGRPVTRAGDGRLWFVTGAGVTIMDPKTLETVSPPGPVRVERVIANETTFAAAPALRLPARSSRLQIDYTVVNLTSPLRTNFRYRLEGFDPDWISAGTVRQASYTNLPPRPYRFVVVASNSEGTPLSETAWDFSIDPMFYQTRWFSTAMLAALALAGWGAWRLRLREVRREFALRLHERTRVSREIHDTLLQSLVGVSLQFDALSGDLPASASKTKDQLVRMRKQVEEHIREARHSIWNLRSPTLRRRDLGNALREFAEQAAAPSGIAVDVDINGEPPLRIPKVEEQLLRIGQEAITNAVRHAGAHRIRVRLDYRPRDVALSIADDGRGFNYPGVQRAPNGHYGLVTMRERAEEIGGTLHISSSAPTGTEITAIVPQTTRVEEPVDVGA